MEISRLNRTDPERVFMTFKNSYSTASLTAGQWCAFDATTDEDGVSVTKPAALNLSSIAGVVTQTITSGSYGLVQVWGFRSDARCTGGTGGSAASKATSGKPLFFSASGFAAAALARTTVHMKRDNGAFPCGVVYSPTNTAARVTQLTTAQYKVMIKCL